MLNVWVLLGVSLAAMLGTPRLFASTSELPYRVETEGFAQESTGWRADSSAADFKVLVDTSPAIGHDLRLQLELAASGRPGQIYIDSGDRQYRRIDLHRDNDGAVLTARIYQYDADAAEWSHQEPEVSLPFWPRTAAALEIVESDGIAPRTWHGRPLHLRIGFYPGQAIVWLEGRMLAAFAHAENADLSARFTLDQGDVLKKIAVAASADERYHVVDLSALANEPASVPLEETAVELDGVPFHFAGLNSRWLDLREAHWVDWLRNPQSVFEAYDRGPYFLGDPRMPMVQLPKADYVAAHVLALADDDPSLGNRLTLRMGRSSPDRLLSAQVVHYDFPADIPRPSDVASSDLQTMGGSSLMAVRVPIHRTFAQDIEGDLIDVELTKAVRLARRSPDPNRFRWRPLGLPSGVRIAAITFERSPLQWQLGSEQAGHLFVQPQSPTFTAKLTNITAAPQPFRLELEARHAHGQVHVQQQDGEVQPHATAAIELKLEEDLARGYYDLTANLYGADGGLLLTRTTSFAVLPPDTRQHVDNSPFGTTGFGRTHFSPHDPEVVGPMHQKLGLRYGMNDFPGDARKPYNLRRAREFSYRIGHADQDPIENYQALLAEHPDQLPHLLMFHEDAISGHHAARVPDIFHDRAPYQLNEAEQQRFDQMWDLAIAATTAFREHYPDTRIYLGNGGLVLREELYRHGFPTELFDFAGNENPSFSRLPETQPPDHISNNASLWMDRQMLDAYGYDDKPVGQVYETLYPSTNPGNLSMETQAAYLLRHVLHSLAWEVPIVRPNMIADVGNSYYFSNWGASGLFHAYPEVNPKPAAVAYATLTHVLDGATFDRVLPMGSVSLYGMQFARPDGSRAIAYWTIRGERPVRLEVSGAAQVTLMDAQGVETQPSVEGGMLTLTATPMPGYLILPANSEVGAIHPGTPIHQSSPRGEVTLLSPMDSLESWSVAEEKNLELEFYNPFTPRRLGNFKFEPVSSFEGRKNVLRVTPQPLKGGKPTMPMYMELVHEQGVELPGQPTDIGLWVNGNSSWGRVIFEMRDASGQRWTSIGAPAERDSQWMRDWLPRELVDQYDPGQKISDWNTNDAFGLSRINFDGWRYVSFPLPGQYIGEGYGLPANSQWRWSGDGVVHYPLTLTKLIVELPEKTLHVKRYEPVPRPEIYLSNLVAVEGDGQHVKQAVGPYEEQVQLQLRDQ